MSNPAGTLHLILSIAIRWAVEVVAWQPIPESIEAYWYIS